MRDGERIRLYDDASEELDRIGTVLADRIAAIRDAMAGHPGAQRYDTPRTSGHTTTKFCEQHERDNCDCGQATTYPAVSDPTGEAAATNADHGDQASRDLAQVDRDLRTAHGAIVRISRTLQRYRPRPASARERAETDSDPEPGCDSCARTEVSRGVPRWSPPYVLESTVNGNLAEPRCLCRWCHDVVRDLGRLPTEAEVEDHHRGKRMRRPA